MMATTITRESVKTPKRLFKYLMRKCNQLPAGPQEFYKHSVRQSFKQHMIEPDPERVQQIMNKAFYDTEWIMKKVIASELLQDQRVGKSESARKIDHQSIPQTSSLPIDMTMNFEVIVSDGSPGSPGGFWRAMDIWLKGPHLVNRRISSCINLLTAILLCDATEMIDILFKVESEILQYCSKGNVEKSLNLINKCTLLTSDCNPLGDTKRGTYLLVNKHLPRDSAIFSPGLEFVFIEKESKSILCYHRSIDPEKRPLSLNRPYKITLDVDNRFNISVQRTSSDSLDPSVQWLREKLFPRLRKWKENEHPDVDALVEGSLNLVSPEKYSRLYNQLKQKYGTEMVKKWPECTDPNKFVYEDVAIATYLILLWEQERIGDDDRKQSFVDLGCGNGLLVHILTSEGHAGTGIDLRKRQIWDIYPPATRLLEQTIVPSSSTLFPEVDWLIGNHSDELTPWIPVIAARSSYTCRFFLLPCCAHEFDGRKFQRDNATKSQYFEYMKYVKSVCEDCGFKTDLDKLRIPSTKRICLIGGERTHPRESMEARDKLIDQVINARSPREKQRSTNEETEVLGKSRWSADFQPRESVERVRNCTRIDKTIIDEIINVVTTQLLRKVRNVTRNSGGTWNAGGLMELGEIAKILPAETLKQLRNECGGLQTLLRNNSHIFRVIDGSVQLRVPGTEIKNNNKRRKGKKNFQTKVKPCWFYENHPDGCPASDEICNFKHEHAPSDNMLRDTVK